MIEDGAHTRLEDLQIVGTRGASAFYAIVELATMITGAPYAAITVLEGQTRWFYTTLGIRVASTPQADTLCDFTKQCMAQTVFEDLSKEPHFGATIKEPLFPDWRFYAGVPIVYDQNLTIGVLMVADDAPRKLDQHAQIALQSLASLSVESFRLQGAMVRQQEAALDAYRQQQALELTNRELELSRRDVELASMVAKVGFWTKDLGTGAFQMSALLQELLALKAGETVSHDRFIEALAPDARDSFQSQLDAAVACGGGLDVQLPLTTANGETRWIRTTAQVQSLNGAPTRIQGCAQDVTELVSSREQMARMAKYDPLTGACTRRFLPAAFAEKRRGLDPQAETLTVLTVDLDHFKTLNDARGHDAGDAVLIAAAQILSEEAGPGAVVARLGGDEFLVLAAGPRDADLGADVAARARARFAAAPEFNRYSRAVTASIGYAETSATGADFATVLKQADLAVYEAKRRGRDCAVRFEATLSEESAAREAVLADVDAALDADAFEPFYQPKVDILTGEVVGLEALARWRKDDAYLSPAAFAAALDDPRLARRISDCVLEKAVRDASAMLRAGVRFGRVAVNATDTQLTEPGFAARVVALCAEHGLPPEMLEIELTEKCLLSREPDLIRACLDQLAEQGVSTAFDDFGTGFASLTHLRDFRIDEIKIDMSFIRNLMVDATAKGITDSIIHLAKQLRKRVVAEGVETAEIEAALKDMGCDVSQGYHHSKPLPLKDLTGFLAARAAA